MSITSLTRSLFLLLAATLLLAPSARAVEREHDYVPFIDPLSFDPDFQFFAPAELGDFGEPPDPSIGWFAEYKRAYLWVSRPENEMSHTQGDFTWANQIDVGWMKEDQGWLISGMHMSGPNEADVLLQPRVNRVDLDDIDPDDDTVNPPQDRNDTENFFSRNIAITNSLNIARLSNIEVNKVWRMEPLHRGGILEPFVGFRYMGILDQTIRSRYLRRDLTGLPAPFPDQTGVVEDSTYDVAYWHNDMFGGQLGMRWSEYKSRWVLSNELRVFALQNFQAFDRRIDRALLAYDGVGTDTDLIEELYTRSGFSTHDGEFVYGVDVRIDAAFQLTRDINIIVGGTVMHLPQGVARGNDELLNSEDFTMAGGHVAVSLNR